MPCEPLDNRTYAYVQATLLNVCRVMADLPLDRFLASINRAETVGPIVDPTLFLLAGQTLAKVADLGRAAATFQATIRRVRGEEGAQTDAP